MFNLDKFISQSVTFRQQSMFLVDVEANKDALLREIRGKKVCVIGGAGTIGSSFIKAVLRFEPGSLVVVDINENGLASRSDGKGYSRKTRTAAKITIQTFGAIVQLRQGRQGIFDMEQLGGFDIVDPRKVYNLVLFDNELEMLHEKRYLLFGKTLVLHNYPNHSFSQSQ